MLLEKKKRTNALLLSQLVVGWLLYHWKVASFSSSSPWTTAFFVRSPPSLYFAPLPTASQRRWAVISYATKEDAPKEEEEEYRNLWSVQKCLDMYLHHPSADAEEVSNARCDTGTVRFVDGTWYHKGSRNGRRDFLSGPRVPGSVYFDISDVALRKELYPQQNPLGLSQMQPPPTLFAAYMDAVQISNDDIIVIYASSVECAFLPRVWCTFRHVMGHAKVFLMHGSLQEWIDLGGPVDARPLLPSDIPLAKDLVARCCDNDWTQQEYQVVAYNPNFIVQHSDVAALVAAKLPNATSSTEDAEMMMILVDTRGSSFATEGQIPYARHVPYSSFHRPKQPLLFHSKTALRSLLIQYGLLLPNAPAILEPPPTMVLSCGTGVSVCNLVLALDECGGLQTSKGKPNVRVYDGSWEEWRALPGVPFSRDYGNPWLFHFSLGCFTSITHQNKP